MKRPFGSWSEWLRACTRAIASPTGGRSTRHGLSPVASRGESSSGDDRPGERSRDRLTDRSTERQHNFPVLRTSVERRRTVGGKRRCACTGTLTAGRDPLKLHHDPAFFAAVGGRRGPVPGADEPRLPPRDPRLLPRSCDGHSGEPRLGDSPIAPQRVWLARPCGVESGVESTGSNWGGALSILRRQSEAPTHE